MRALFSLIIFSLLQTIGLHALEREHFSVFEKYFFHKFSAGELTTRGALIQNIYAEELSLQFIKGNQIFDKDKKTFLLDECHKKALLMAILRINFYNAISPLELKNENLQNILIYNSLLQKIWSFYGVDWSMNYCLVGRGYVINLENTKNIYPRRALFETQGFIYDKELIDVFRSVIPKEDIIESGREDLKFCDFEISKSVLKYIRNVDVENLSKMYDLLTKLWDSEAVVSAYAQKTDKIYLDGINMSISGEKWQSLLVAIMRLRVNVEIYAGMNLHTMTPSGAPIYNSTIPNRLQVTLPSGEKLLLYIGNESNVVGLSVPLDNALSLLVNGIYYSPECYNLVMSLFSELAYKSYLKNSGSVSKKE